MENDLSIFQGPIESVTTPDSVSLSSLSHAGSNHSQKSPATKSPQMVRNKTIRNKKSLLISKSFSPQPKKNTCRLIWIVSDVLFQHSPVYSEQNLTTEKTEKILATLVRDPMGLGFSIAGGKGAEPYIEGSESVFISKIAEGGPASRDGKLQVGDRIIQVRDPWNIRFASTVKGRFFALENSYICSEQKLEYLPLCFLQINGVDVREAEHVQVVELLTGTERFVRLSVERKITSPTSSNFPSDFGLPATPPSASGLESGGKGVSPKVFGLPKPYTGLYSASSYMANRPSYMRTREPGQVR